MAWQIFVHSVRQVFGNLEGSLRVSAVLTIVQAVITLALGQFVLGDPVSLQTRMLEGNFDWASYVIVLVMQLLLGLWIAVGWHRYVLTNEVPGLVPRLHLDRVMGYFGKSVLIGLFLLPLLMFGSLVVAMFVAPLFRGQIEAQPFLHLLAMGLLIYVPVATVALRLSTALPGVALKAGVSVFAGWQATVGQTGVMLGLVLLSVVGWLVLGLPSMFVFAPGSVVGLIWQFVTQWVGVMVGASILTTLYGHYVEGRPLV